VRGVDNFEVLDGPDKFGRLGDQKVLEVGNFGRSGTLVGPEVWKDCEHG
jgi:hypothetical protein